MLSEGEGCLNIFLCSERYPNAMGQADERVI